MKKIIITLALIFPLVSQAHIGQVALTPAQIGYFMSRIVEIQMALTKIQCLIQNNCEKSATPPVGGYGGGSPVILTAPSSGSHLQVHIMRESEE